MNLNRASAVVLFLAMSMTPVAGRAQNAKTAHDELGGTSWQLVTFADSDGKTLKPDDKTKYTVAFGKDGNVSVRIDCNRGRGTWKSEQPAQLEFGPLATTRALCPKSPITDRITMDWQYVRSYVLKGGHFYMRLMTDGGSYEFEPMTSNSKAQTSVKGTATYRERIALPPGAMFEATLEDVSRADAPAEMIGRARLTNVRTPPFSFEITYDPGRIDPRHRYAVRGRIVSEGRLMFTTDQQYSVLTGGNGSEVELLLKGVSAAPQSHAGAPVAAAGVAGLENVHWVLMDLGGTGVSPAAVQKEPYLILDAQTHRVSGSSGCNQFGSGYELKGTEIKFTGTMGTLMACAKGMDTEKTFLAGLGKVQSWKIVNGRLQLFDAAGNMLARFEAKKDQ